MSPLHRDALFIGALRIAAAGAGGIVLLIFVFLSMEALPALRHAGAARFVTDPSWHPAADASEGTFLLVPMLWGTLLATIGAVLLATPLGLLSAVFCHDVAPRPLAAAYRRIIELLAGIPSVVYGFWGLVVLVPLILKLRPPGQSLLAGILVLAMMILPTIALTAFAAVPREFRAAAAALGLSRWTTLRRIVAPVARAGLYSGILLAVGRALGETMAVLMVCGNIVQTPRSLFDPVRTLTANMALEMAYAFAGAWA